MEDEDKKVVQEEIKQKTKRKDSKKLKNDNFLDAVSNAINGILYATTTQSNVKKQLVIAVLVLIVSLFFDLEKTEFLILVFAVVLVIFAEMINTAIEAVVDLYVDVYHEKAKVAKDVGAGAVVLSAINGVIVAYFLFFDKLDNIGTVMISNIKSTPAHTVFMCLIITLIIVLYSKVISKRNNDKFSVSGQTVLAFAVFMIVFINTTNVLIIILTAILAVMVMINRLKQSSRTVVETFFGVAMGILIVVLIYGLINMV